jgi:hypothetical protein
MGVSMKATQKMLVVTSISICGIVLITGCETLRDPHKALADVVRPLGGRVMVEGKEVGSHVKAEPKAGSPQTNSGTTANTKTYKEICTNTNATSTVDIDTLYARAMSRFSFKNVDQRAHMKTQGYMTPDNYRHTAQTGTYYSLAETVQIKNLSNKTAVGWLELTFAKEGKNVMVTTMTCLDENGPLYAASKQEFPSAIASLVAP